MDFLPLLVFIFADAYSGLFLLFQRVRIVDQRLFAVKCECFSLPAHEGNEIA